MDKIPSLDSLLDYGDEYKYPDLITSDYFVIDKKRQKKNNQNSINNKNNSNDTPTDNNQKEQNKDNLNDSSNENQQNQNNSNASDVDSKSSSGSSSNDNSSQDSSSSSESDSSENNDSNSDVNSKSSSGSSSNDDFSQNSSSSSESDSSENNDSISDVDSKSSSGSSSNDKSSQDSSSSSEANNSENNDSNSDTDSISNSDNSSNDNSLQDSSSSSESDTLKDNDSNEEEKDLLDENKEEKEKDDRKPLEEKDSDKEKQDNKDNDLHENNDSDDENDFDDLMNNYDEDNDTKRNRNTTNSNYSGSPSDKLSSIHSSKVYKTLKKLVSLSYERYTKGTYKYNKKDIVKHYITNQKFRIMDDMVSPTFKPDVYVFDLSPSNDNSLELYVNTISSVASKGSIIYLTFNERILRKLTIKKNNSSGIDVEKVAKSNTTRYQNFDCEVFDEFRSLYDELKDIKNKKIYVFSDFDVSEEMCSLSQENDSIVWFSTENSAHYGGMFDFYRPYPTTYKGYYVETQGIDDIEKYVLEKNKSKYKTKGKR